MIASAQMPLPMAPAGARQISLATGLVEDDDGGRVFINGQLSFAWDAGDEGGRRLAAVQLVRIKAASQRQVAAAFGVNTFTVYRWEQAVAGHGAAGLAPVRKGPKRPSKLTDAVVADIAARRAAGQALAGIAAAVGVSRRSVSAVLARGRDAGTSGARPDYSGPDTAAGAGGGDIVVAAAGVDSDGRDQQDADPAGLPVLPPRADRNAERAWARTGLLDYAEPRFVPAARVPLAGLLLAVPALVATGLLEVAHRVYGDVPNGFYGLDTVLCDAVFRALAGEPRAEGASRVNPTDLGRVLGLDRAPEVKTVRRKISQLASRQLAADLQQAMARRHLADRGQDTSILYVDGHVRVYQGTRKVQKTL